MNTDKTPLQSFKSYVWEQKAWWLVPMATILVAFGALI